MTTLEQIIEAARRLPFEDRRQLREWLQEQERLDARNGASTGASLEPSPREQERLDAEPPPATPAPPSAETVEEQVARFRKAMKWIDEHRAEYLGQWVVLVGDQLISHGFDGHQVGDQAKAAGIETPFMVLVREEPEAFMSGLL